MTDLTKRLNELSEGANPGPYGVISYQSGTTYLTLGEWVGSFAGDTGDGKEVSFRGSGRAEIVNFNIPRKWRDQNRKGYTARFLVELANAWRDGKLIVKEPNQ